ncbi:hypothetical protein N2152v2_003745 [Parachlorella kessleri]
MKRIFGQKKTKEPPPTLEQASDKLSNRGDALDEKIRKLDEQLAKHKEAIKKCRPGPAQEAAKRRALGVLKQKRMYESQREQLYNQQFNVDQTAFTMESAKDSIQTVQAMKAASVEMKAAFKNNKELQIDHIEGLQDDLVDFMDRHNEIQDVLGQTYALPDDVDESDLMDELNALEDDLASEAVGSGATPAYLQEPDLPEVPSGQASQPQAQDEFGLPAVPQRT